MSSLILASDLHGNREAYDCFFALEVDAIVLGGDLLPYPLKRGGDLLALQTDFVKDYLAAKVALRLCYWILGNDDWEAAFLLLNSRGIPIHGRAVLFLDGFSITKYG